MSPFDFTKQIEHGKQNLIDENPELEKEYKPFIVNRALSFSHDMVLYANLMNEYNHLDSKYHLVKSVRLPDGSFVCNGRTSKKSGCAFFIWQKKDCDRVELVQQKTKGYTFDKKNKDTAKKCSVDRTSSEMDSSNRFVYKESSRALGEPWPVHKAPLQQHTGTVYKQAAC